MEIPLFGISRGLVDRLQQHLEEGLFTKDVTKLKDMMLSVGRKMLDLDYREYYAASLGDIVQNLGMKLKQATITSEFHGSGILRLVSNYFEVLNGKHSQSVLQLNLYAADRSLADHAVRFSLLAMAIGLELKLGPKDVQDLGALGLLANLAMVQLPEELRQVSRPFNKIEQISVNKIPQQTSMLLSKLVGISTKTAAVASQVYELGDGSGFPRGLKLATTNPLARILRVANAYVVLLETKSYRPGVHPLTACVYLLQYARGGYYDQKAVAALMNVVGYYPTTTEVTLSDGRRAVVLGASKNASLPVVYVQNENQRLDLSETALSITGTVLSEETTRITSWQHVPKPFEMEMPGCCTA